MYFILPVLYPSIIESFPTDDSQNVVLQSKYQEWTDEVSINDTSNALPLQLINNTETSIIIQNGSRISATFSANAIVMLDSTFAGLLTWDIVLAVESVKNVSFYVSSFIFSATGIQKWYTMSIYTTLMTKPLNSGTYTIRVYWRCQDAAAGVNWLYLNNPAVVEPPRSLAVQEIK